MKYSEKDFNLYFKKAREKIRKEGGNTSFIKFRP